MGDHLALSVDRLLTDSTLEATSESRKQAQSVHHSASSSLPVADLCQDDEAGKLVECRICQEEDEVSNMENPCSCSGSLKYAHRKCVQRWCNEKGDSMCEICLQQFKPGYTAPAPLPLFHYGTIPMDFRGSWEISSRGFHDSQIITMAPSDRDVVGSSDYDYNSSTTQSTICCRSVAIIFMTLLFLRHFLPLMLSEDEDYSLALFSLLILRSAGILIPIAVIARTLTIFQHRRRRRQVSRNIPILGSDEESARSPSVYQSQTHIIHAH